MTRNKYFNELLEKFERHIEATDARTEWEIQVDILNFIEKNRLPDEDHESVPSDWWTGPIADNH